MTLVDGFAEPAREEMLVRVADERAAWQELIEAAGDRVNEPGPAGDWTLRDVVAHINGYQRFLVGSMGGRVRDVGPMPAEAEFDVQKRNEWLHGRDRDRTWNLVAAEAQELHVELLAQLGARSQEQLRAPMVAWNPWPTWRWVIHLTHEHYEEHLPDLRKWLGLGS
ncbi:MAG TPA: ClbS/DfsB family four-helix bundle protein [Chloroflexota bacterium]